MKKAITILAVLIVLVSAVFADETHRLKIKATQAEIAPAFQMYVKAITNGTKDENVVTNSGAVRYDAVADDSFAPYIAPIEEDLTANPPQQAVAESGVAATFSFETASTVTVAVKLGNAAKTAQNYSLTFTGGSFSVTKNGASATVNPESRTAAAGTNSTTGGTGGFETRPNGAGANVDFSGQTCTAGHEIATCAYAYDAHTDVDPGTYLSDVILTIATTN